MMAFLKYPVFVFVHVNILLPEYFKRKRDAVARIRLTLVSDSSQLPAQAWPQPRDVPEKQTWQRQREQLTSGPTKKLDFVFQ